MKRPCFITPRFSGPCSVCRRPANPAHVPDNGSLIFCASCCPVHGSHEPEEFPTAA
jgi:hypothetical protein